MTVLTAHHTTTYRYKRAVGFGKHHMMVQPRSWADQRLLEHSITITPEPAKIEASLDPFGNWITVASFDRPATELSFESRVRVEKVPAADGSSVLGAADSAQAESPDFLFWLQRTPASGADTIDEWVHDVARVRGRSSPFDRLSRLNAAIRAEFRYVRRLEKGTQPAAETLRLGSGSCRDFATLMIDGARALGYPARFASGYIRVPGGDRTIVGGGSTHAWVQAYVPDTGWVDFDPTNGSVSTRDLIRIAAAPRAEQALPLCGTWSGKADDCIGMTVTVTVTSDAALNGARSAPPSRTPAANFCE